MYSRDCPLCRRPSASSSRACPRIEYAFACSHTPAFASPLAHPRTITPSRYIAMPKAFVDEQRHAYPIGPDQLDKFRKGEDEYGRTNYYTDPRALKLLSQDQWNQDRPLYDIQNPDLPVAKERRDYFVGSQRTLNYIRHRLHSNKQTPTPCHAVSLPLYRLPPCTGAWCRTSSAGSR